MQKKDVEGKKQIKRKKSTQINRTTKNKRNNINTNGFKIAAILATIALLLICYMMLGFEIAILMAVFIAIIIGVVMLFGKVKNKKKKRKIISLFLILFLTLGIAALCTFSAFMIYVKAQADPKYKNAKLNTLEVSRLYDKDGNEFAKLGSEVVKNSFTDKYGEKTSGASGITRKFEDIYLAIFKLEKDYSKQEIIEFYVNNHFLGGNTYGVQEASEAYFGKSVTELNLSEAAILAGMFKSPNAYKPTANPKNAAARRKTVLYLMRRHGYITKEEEEIANSIPVESLTSESNESTENQYQGYIDTVVDELKETYGVNPYTTPLLVYTNLDRARQDAVLSVLAGENYNWKDDRVQSGVAVLDSQTGKILAIGNGRNVNSRSNSNADQYNYATEIHRQPGSTAKPLFDYGPGIEYNNWSTYEQFDDSPYSYSNGRAIHNWDRGYYGTLTLRKALSASRNIPALKAFQQVDNNKIREFVTNLGITPEICSSGYKYDKDKDRCINTKDANDVKEPSALHEAHSIGAFTGVSPLEMAGAYAAFSNGGYYNKPYAVEKVIFRQTKKEEVHKSDKKQVMSDATAFMISSVLQDVSLTGGTPSNVACKTGTTNYDSSTMSNYGMPDDAIRDSWVIGYSTKTVIGMWYGYDSLTKDLIQQGYILHNIPATIAKDRLFNALVSAGAMESNREAFSQPSSVVKIGVAAGSNPAKLAAPGGNTVYEYFKKGHEPTEYDTSNYKLGAPGNLSITETNDRVTLSWSGVDPGPLAQEGHGNFGYNIYKDGILIDWTDKTSYTFKPSGSIYGTYKIIGTYKSYSGVQSEAASKKLEEAKDERKTTPTPASSPTPTQTPQESPNSSNP